MPTTYLSRRKRFYRKKKAPRRYKSKMPFSKRQSTAIKSLALKTVNKTRELKCVNFHVDEQQLAFGSQGQIQTNLTNTLLNDVRRGDARNQRIGNQINPARLVLSGWCKINGDSTTSAYQELKVRVLVGYMDSDVVADMNTSLVSVPLFWNGQSQIQTGDYRDILRNINFNKFKPFYDRTHSIAPAQKNTYDSASPSTQSRLKDHFNIKINKKFNPKNEITWDTTANSRFQKQNLVMLTYIRAMNDDTVFSTAVCEFNIEGNYYYHDA